MAETDRVEQAAGMPIERRRRLRRWAEVIVLGLVTNIVWTAILAAPHWLPRSWHTWHLKWLPANTGFWSGMLSFFTVGAPNHVKPWLGILLAAITAIWLLGSFPDYFANRRGRNSDWDYARKKAEHAGRMLVNDILLRFLCAIYLIFVIGTLLFLAETIYNITAGHPLLTPLPHGWGN